MTHDSIRLLASVRQGTLAFQRQCKDSKKPMMQLIYASGSEWPKESEHRSVNGHGVGRNCATGSGVRRVLVLDSSFNPPTLAHLQLASMQPRPGTGPSDYDAHALLFSISNMDKGIAGAKSGEATIEQRVELMIAFAKELEQVLRKRKNGTYRPSVAVFLANEGRFAIKSRLLRNMLRSHASFCDTTDILESAAPDHRLPVQDYVMGTDTIVRFFAKKYYDGIQGLHRALESFFREDGSGIVCVQRGEVKTGEEAAFFESQEVRQHADPDRETSSSGVWMTHLDKTFANVSSTKAREACQNKDATSLRELLPPMVMECLQEEGLYQVPPVNGSAQGLSHESAEAMRIARSAKEAFELAQLLQSDEREKALHIIATELQASKSSILEANQEDLRLAKELHSMGKLSASLLSRLDLTKGRKFDDMVDGVLQVSSLADPTGRTTYATLLDDGLELTRVTCPIGVLLCVFEARPEVVVNISALAIKSGNAAILKGGKESTRTAKLLTQVIATALAKTKLPPLLIQYVSTREEIRALLDQEESIDLVIPRGGKELVRYVKNNTKIPVMGHADGLCTMYIDAKADVETALRVAVDSKIDYPAGCNSLETLLVHQDVISTHWPSLGRAFVDAGVRLHCDATTLQALAGSLSKSQRQLLLPATDEDYSTEFLSLDLAVRVVPSLAQAVLYINRQSSHHTDVIITEDTLAADYFLKGVASAGVYVNASSRFADGARYGFGCEVGIATGKTHARGPVGLDGLVIYKYLIRGDSSRKGYLASEMGSGPGKRPYLHRPIRQT